MGMTFGAKRSAFGPSGDILGPLWSQNNSARAKSRPETFWDRCGPKITPHAPKARVPPIGKRACLQPGTHLTSSASGAHRSRRPRRPRLWRTPSPPTQLYQDRYLSPIFPRKEFLMYLSSQLLHRQKYRRPGLMWRPLLLQYKADCPLVVLFRHPHPPHHFCPLLKGAGLREPTPMAP